MKFVTWALAVITISSSWAILGESHEEEKQTIDQNDDAQVVAQVADAFGKIVHGAVVAQNSASHKDKNSQQNFEGAMHEIAAGIALIQSITGGRTIRMQTLEQDLLVALKKLDRATLNQILRTALVDQAQSPADVQ